jgi:nitroreductase
VLHQDQQALEPLQQGTFRSAAKILSLGQELGGDAAVNIYFLVDLAPVLAHFGNRGYRVAQLEAAILAGRIYLAAYALSLGATGLTFFDDDVTTFFSPHSTGHSVLFLIALGHPASKENKVSNPDRSFSA